MSCLRRERIEKDLQEQQGKERNLGRELLGNNHKDKNQARSGGNENLDCFRRGKELCLWRRRGARRDLGGLGSRQRQGGSKWDIKGISGNTGYLYIHIIPFKTTFLLSKFSKGIAAVAQFHLDLMDLLCPE